MARSLFCTMRLTKRPIVKNLTSGLLSAGSFGYEGYIGNLVLYNKCFIYFVVKCTSYSQADKGAPPIAPWQLFITRMQ